MKKWTQYIWIIEENLLSYALLGLFVIIIYIKNPLSPTIYYNSYRLPQGISRAQREIHTDNLWELQVILFQEEW